MKSPTLRCVLLAVTLAWMSTLTSQAGWIKRYMYYDMPGVTVAELLYGTNTSGVVIFPDTPGETQFIPYQLPPSPSAGPFLAETDPLYQNGIGDNFGSYLPGYIEPPETGDYTFWVCGDDETQLWLTTDPADSLNPAKKQLIASVPVWSNAREWTKYPEQQSAPISLEKGKQYYLEVLHKEGGGGDNVGWGWQLPSGTLERPMLSFYLQPTLNTGDPTVVAGPYAAAVVPAFPGDYSTIYDGMEVMLFADLNLAPPYTVQWLRGAAEITGATQTYHRFQARNADNGAQFSVRVNGTVYGPVALTVYPDNTAPELVSATVPAGNPTRIQVLFSEAVTPASANNLASYTLSSGAIQSAQLQADGRTVILNTGLLAPGVLHVLNISGIQDLAVPPNTIPNTQTSVVVAEGAIAFRAWDFRPTDLATLRRWSSPDSTAPSYVNDMFTEERVVATTSYQWNFAPARDNFSGQLIGYLTAPETGYYKFAIASDDHSILYLGTTDQRSSKREICNYNGSTGRWNVGQQLANQQSALIYLEAGQQYYIEAVYRDGTGGDGVSVFWQTPSGPELPTANANTQAATEPFLIPASQLSTFADPPVAGGLNHRSWDAVPTDLATLRTWSATNSTAASYANNMFVEERRLTTTSYQWNLVPLRDNYMGQMIGYLTAPETGNYKFAIASDDHSILYLGTTDQRSSKREICNYNGSTGRWNVGAQLGNQQSALIALEAGKRYYIEAVYRDGTGGDGVSVFWQTPSGNALPTANESVQANTEPFLIPPQYLSTPATFGNVFLATDLPASINAAESTRPTLSVVADGSPVYAYQWYKNNAPIAGAMAASYTLPYLTPVDNSATFQVVVTNAFSSVTSAVATLTVTGDTTKPVVASVGSLFKQTVEVQLSEPVSSATATATGNYLLLTSAGTPVAVNSATVDVNDAAHITLQTAAMPETDAMTLVVQNLADLSTAANVMEPSTNAFRANNFDLLTRINNSQAFSARAVGDQILMTAGGSDIWGTADQFAFLSKTVTGNFDYKIQGLSLPTVNQWCKMGLMARPSTAAGARNAFNAFTPLSPSQNTYTPQIRDLTGGASTASADAGSPLNLGMQGGVAQRPTVVYPSWLRLQRVGDVFYWYYGTTGTDWTLWTYYDSSLSGEGPLPATLEVGLALTSHDTARTVDGVMASFTAVNDGALFLTLQPTNTTVVEGGTVSFYAGAGGSTPHVYQWLTNGTPIADGITTNATLTLARVPFTFNGLQIACRVSNPYGQVVTTTNALLTVTQDGDRPTVRYYIIPKININPTQVKLLYSEWMEINSAQNPANYQITTSPGGAPLAISSVVLEADERTVTLTTDPQTPGTTYKVVVNNVVDLACCPANSVAPNSTDYFFFAGALPQFVQRADGFIIMEAENAQETTPKADGDTWQLRTDRGGYSGTSYMVVPNGSGGQGGVSGTAPNITIDSAKMVFHINFTRTGRHKVWLRAGIENTATGGNDDSVYVGFNDDVGISDPANDWLIAKTGTADNSGASGWSGAGSGWLWRSDRISGTDPLTFTNTTTGLHRFIIYQREDGSLIDKIVIEAPGTSTSTTAAPAPATANGNLGEPETWDYIVQPPAGPTITISSPVNNQAFAANATIPITAALGGPTPIVLVEFFQGTNLLGTATADPFSFNWPTVPEGIYSLTARATDGLGYQTTSPAVQVIVDSTKPVAYAVGSLQGNGIGVYFRDLSGVDAASATDPANYTVNGGAITVTAATLEPDLRAVMLSLSAPVSGAFSVEVKNVADRGSGPNVMDTVTLQSTVVTWPFNQDVGTTNATPPPVFTDPIMPGFAQAIGTNGFYVHAGGHDIWDAADGMHFVHQSVTGDFDVKVRVDGLTRPNEWTKAGLMVRDNLDGNSRNYLIAATPTNGQNLITMQWRLTNGVASGSLADASRPRPSPIPNAWLRVTRTGDALAFYWGTDGVNWQILHNETPSPAYPATVYVGLATTSHDNGATLANTAGAYYRDLTGLPAIPVPQGPELKISLSGTDVVISWTSSEANLELWATDDLAPANWQPTGATPVAVGDTYTVTIPLTGVDRYFRLVQP